MSRAESLPSNTEPKLENHPSGACRCRPLLAFCAQSIEITWIAAIQSGRFATETSLGLAQIGTTHGESETWWQRLNKALDTTSSDFVNASLLQLQAADQFIEVAAHLNLLEPETSSGAPSRRRRSRWCATRRRKGETTGNTNFDLNRRASPRPYLGARGGEIPPRDSTIPEVGQLFNHCVGAD